MLYMIRHGQTDWNLIQRLQGRTDVPLNENGRRTAREAAEECRKLRFDICYCSPLIRARETAELLLNGTDIPIIPDDRLKEMCFGACEGEIDPGGHPESPCWAFFKDPAHYVPAQGGETFDQLRSRISSFLKEIADPALKEGKNILIVGHGAMNCCLYDLCHDIPVEHFWSIQIPNCTLCRVL